MNQIKSQNHTFRWLGWSTVLPSDAKGHFLQRIALARGSKRFCRTLIMIWIAPIGALWWSRNSSVFQNKTVEIEVMVDSIQFKVWLWLKARERDFVASFYEWL